MLLGIDHLVVAVPDVDAAAAALGRDLGIAVGPGGRHDRWGTHNRIAWLGDTYVELVGVVDEALARESWIGRPTLAALERGGGLVTFALATDAIEADSAILRGRGAGLGPAIPGERLRPDGRTVHWSLAGPSALAPTAPFLIQHDPTAAEWTPAERAERAGRRHPAGGPIRLEVLELPVDDVSRAYQRLARGAGLRFRPSLAGHGARDADVGRQVVRIRPVRDEDAGITAVIRLAGPDLPDLASDAWSCRWVVRPG